MTERIVAAWHYAYGEYRNLTVILFATLVMTVAAFLVPAAALIEVMLATLIASSTFVVLSSLRDAARAVRNGLREGWELQLVGTVLFFAAADILAGWGILFRWLGRPDWMTDTPFIAFVRYFAALGAWMVMFAPRDRDGRVPGGTWGWFTAFVAGVITTITVLALFGQAP